MASLADKLKEILDATLAVRPAEACPTQGVERLAAELGTRLAGFETILGRLAASGRPDAAVAVQRTDDLGHLVEALRAELARRRKQDDVAGRRNREMLEGIIRKIDNLAPAAAEHGAAAVLAALMPRLVGTARESSLVEGFTKLTEVQERQHAELMGAIKEAQRAPAPKPDRQTMQRHAAERALSELLELRRHTKLQTHPAEYVVERYHIGSSVTVERMADTKLRVWVSQWQVVQTREGWVPSEFAEIADRAVAVVASFRRELSKPSLVVVA